MKQLAVLLIGFAACAAPDAPESTAQALLEAASGDDVLGTIEATVDGQPMTWYVVAGDVRGSPYASAAWHQPNPDAVIISVGGFDTRTPPFDSFQTGAGGTPVSFGDYDGTIMSVMLATGPEPVPYRREFPASDMTAFVYLSSARLDDVGTMFLPQSGVIDVTVLELSNGRIRAQGTFSGRLGNPGGTGRFVEVTDGRFSVDGIPHLDTVAGG